MPGRRKEVVTNESSANNTGRRRPVRVVSSLGEGKLVDRFQNAMSENQTKKKQRERGEKAFQTAKEKRDQKMAKFQEELDALLNDEEPVATTKSNKNQVYVPRLTGTVKGKFEALEQKKKEEEKAKAAKERQRRVERDTRERKRIELELAKKKLEGTISDDDDFTGSKVVQTKKKPGKISLNFEEMDRRRKEEGNRKIENERRLKVESEMRRFKAEKEKTNSYTESSDEEIEKEEKRLPGKLKTNFDDVVRVQEEKQRTERKSKPKRLASSFTNFDILEKERRKRERAKELEKSQLLLQQETFSIKAAKATFKEDSTQSSAECSSESEENNSNSGTEKYPKMKKTLKPSRLDSEKLNFDILENQRIENQRLRIQERRKQLLEEEKRAFKNAKINMQDNSDDEDTEETTSVTSTPQKLDNCLVNFDKITREKFSQEEKRIQEERRLLMEEEIKLMEEEKNRLKKEQLEDDEEFQAQTVEKRKPKKLSRSFAEFDLLERQRKRVEKEKLYQLKAQLLEEERRSFKEARDEMKMENDIESSDDDVEIKSGISRAPKKLSSAFTNFDKIAQEKAEKERLNLQENRIKNLESEVRSFEEEKKKYQENVDDVTSGTKELIKLGRDSPRPRKLSSSFTKFDMLEQQRRSEEREKLHQEKMNKLQEERRHFLQAETQAQSDSDQESSCKQNTVIPIQKIDIRSRMEVVMKAQEEAERKRIEETKFSRMTVEQQEMFLAKQRQIELLKQQLANAQDETSSVESGDEYYYYYSDESEEESDDDDFETDDEECDDDSSASEGNESIASSDGTNSSGSYSGAPCFVETLKNLTVKEGDPVCFEVTVNANPHPKIIWYFKNRAIRNSSDYEYLNKGSQYSLYMNESFVDDTGEYMCKVSNSKGIATGKATLTVIEASDGE